MFHERMVKLPLHCHCIAVTLVMCFGLGSTDVKGDPLRAEPGPGSVAAAPEAPLTPAPLIPSQRATRARRWIRAGGTLVGFGIAFSIVGIGILGPGIRANTGDSRFIGTTLAGSFIAFGMLGFILPGGIVLGRGLTFKARLQSGQPDPPGPSPLENGRRLAIAGGTMAAVGFVSMAIGGMVLGIDYLSPDIPNAVESSMGLLILGGTGFLIPGTILMAIGLDGMRRAKQQNAIQVQPSFGPHGAAVTLTGQF